MSTKKYFPCFSFSIIILVVFLVENILSQFIDDQRLIHMFDNDKKLIFGDVQDESLIIKDISKYGCFGAWLQMDDFKEEVTALTIDKENGSKVTLRFIFQNARASSTFGIEYLPENQLIKIISKDIKKDVKPDDWMYFQICLKDKKFKPYVYYPKGELKMDAYVKMNIGTCERSTAYVASNGERTEISGHLYSPFYTRGLLLDDIADLRNFGISTNHVILDFMKFPLSNYNNLKNFVDNPRIDASFARFNGTAYHFASGEYSQYYPDIKIKQDS